MKKQFIYLALLCLFVACNQAPPTTAGSQITEAETQITKDLIQGAFDNLWGGVDTNKILDYHTPDFYILEQGEVWTNTELRYYIDRQSRRPEGKRRENRMEYLNIEKHGESISIAYKNYASFYMDDSLTGNAQWLESALAVPTKNGWRLRMMHSTKMK
jgi:hypothetical protein